MSMSQKIKVSVIRLTPQDSLSDAVRFVTGATYDRVFLIIPVGNDLLVSLVGLKTLRKRALEAKKEIILSVPTTKHVDFAKQAGLIATTEKDVSLVPPSLWEEAHKQALEYTSTRLYGTDKTPSLVGRDLEDHVSTDEEPTKKTLPLVSGKLRIDSKEIKRPLFNAHTLLLLLMSTLVILSIAAAVFFVYYRFFPRLYITMVIKAFEVKKDYTILGTQEIEGIDLKNKRMGIRRQIFEITESIVKQVTTEVEEGEYATGIIRVYNNTTEDITLPAGTYFRTPDNKLYISTAAVTVPSMVTADVSVRAQGYGEEYNLPAGTLFSVYLPDNSAVSGVVASNPSAIKGGRLEKVKVVSEEEVNAAKKELADIIKERLKERMQDYAKTQEFVLIEDSITFEEKDVSVEPAVGSKANEFTLTMTMNGYAYYYDTEALETLLEELVLSEYKTKDSTRYRVSKLNYSVSEENFDKTKNTLSLKVKVEGIVAAYVDEKKILEVVRQGKYKDIYGNLKTEFGDITEQIKVSFTPEWMPAFLRYVPEEDTRIEIELLTVTK